MHFQQSAAERERLTALAEQRLSEGLFGGLKRRFFRKILRDAHTYLPWRENPKYYVLKMFMGARKRFAEIGRRWCVAGLLAQPDDIYFLTLPEIEAFSRQTAPDAAAIQALVRQRQAEGEANAALVPPLIVRSDGKSVALLHPETPPTDVLRGVSASSGQARGKARVIFDPADGCAFDKGEILVAPFTDPGWTPLFLTARALVMEVGGVMCHGAVVAREYGIPAVVGVKHATTLIQTGADIIVDGDGGRVILVKPADA